jgi:hypothetical protein
MDAVLVFGCCARPAVSDLWLALPAPAAVAVAPPAAGLVLFDAVLGVVLFVVLPLCEVWALFCLAKAALETFWCTR